MTADARNALFALLRAALGEGTPPPAPSEAVCNELLPAAARQALLPIVFDTLKKVCPQSDALGRFDRMRLKDAYHTIQQDVAAASVRAALDGARIPYVLLKGAAIRALYPDPEWRTGCDVDILIERDRLDEAIAAVESGTDFVMKQRNYHDVSLVNDVVHLELHFSLLENMENIDALLSRAWEFARPTGEGSLWRFDPTYQVFHVVAHMSYHMVHGGLGVRPFLDLWLLRTKTSFDEDALRRMCESCGILTFYEACCDLVCAWMEGTPVPDRLAPLETYCLDGGVFGHEKNAVASRLRERSKTGYVFRRLFPGKAVLQEEYPGLKGRPLLLPWYTVKRWTRLFDKRKRATALNDVRGVNAATPETVADFDRLLTELGL